MTWEQPGLDTLETPETNGVRAKSKGPGSKKARIGGVLDPNKASLAELQTLPGVGPALSERIIEARSERPFRNADDLDRVKGIGPAKLEKLRPHLIF